MCCGKTIRKAANIASGIAMAWLDSLFVLPTERHDMSMVRLATCKKCDKVTWLYRTEYKQYLEANNIKLLKELTELESKPELPKMEYRKKANRFCMICKCWLPAKAMLKTEKCPLGKW